MIFVRCEIAPRLSAAIFGTSIISATAVRERKYAAVSLSRLTCTLAYNMENEQFELMNKIASTNVNCRVHGRVSTKEKMRCVRESQSFLTTILRFLNFLKTKNLLEKALGFLCEDLFNLFSLSFKHKHFKQC